MRRLSLYITRSNSHADEVFEERTDFLINSTGVCSTCRDPNYMSIRRALISGNYLRYSYACYEKHGYFITAKGVLHPRILYEREHDCVSYEDDIAASYRKPPHIRLQKEYATYRFYF